MPLSGTDLIRYGSANRPADDASAAGGAVDLTDRPELNQLTANSVIAAVSDGADTRQLTVEGRLASGALDTEVLALNGTTEVVGAKTFERVLRLTLSATDPTRTVTVRQGAGGASVATIGPGEVSRTVMFRSSASDSVQRVRYEKFFWRNTNPEIALLSASVTLTADPRLRIRIGLAPTVNDSGSVTNRLTAPASVTFVDDNVAQAVPGGVLGPGQSIGVWVEQTLPPEDAPHKSTFTTQLAGVSA